MSGPASLPDDWVDRLVRWAQRHERIDRLFVFGSRARGDNRPDSDLDIAVMLSGSDESEILGYWICEADRWRGELTPHFPVRVDLQFADPETDRRVWPGVQRDGRFIYSRETPVALARATVF